MTLTVVSGSGIAMKSPLASTFDFDLVAEEESVFVSGDIDERQTVMDAIVDVSASSTADNAFSVAVLQTAGPKEIHDQIELSTSGSGTIDGNRVNRVSDGLCVIQAKCPWLTKRKTVTMARAGGQTLNQFVSYVDGSLSMSCSDSIDNRLTVGKSKYVYSTQDHSSRAYIRNIDFWGSDLDFTGASPWNSDGQHYKGGAAISPIHMIFAAHWTITNGSSVRFITSDNQIVTRTVVSSVLLDPLTDCQIIKLESDLPSSIRPFKVFPSEVMDYLPSINYGVPIVVFDQEEKAFVQDWKANFTIDQTGTVKILRTQSLNETRAPFSESVIAGDSGNPVFCVVADDPVLMGIVQNITTTPAIYSFIDEINAVMTTLGGGYQLSTVDLSAFTNYGE